MCYVGPIKPLSTQKPRKVLMGGELPELQQPIRHLAGLKAPPGLFFSVGYVPGCRAL